MVKGIRRRRKKKTNARGKKREFTFYTLDARFDLSGKMFLPFRFVRNERNGWTIFCLYILIFVIDF